VYDDFAIKLLQAMAPIMYLISIWRKSKASERSILLKQYHLFSKGKNTIKSIQGRKK